MQELLQKVNMVPVQSDIRCLDQQTIQILQANPTDSTKPWALKLLNGDLIVLVPRDEDYADIILEDYGIYKMIGAEAQARRILMSEAISEIISAR